MKTSASKNATLSWEKENESNTVVLNSRKWWLKNSIFIDFPMIIIANRQIYNWVSHQFIEIMKENNIQTQKMHLGRQRSEL